MTNLNKMFTTVCRQYADSTAFFFKNTSPVYREMYADVLAFSHALHARGIRPGDRVAIILRNSPAFITAYFAIIKIGGIVIPINFLLKSREIAYILNDAGAIGLITHENFLDSVHPAVKKVSSIKHMIIDGVSNKDKNVGNELPENVTFISFSEALKAPREETDYGADRIDENQTAMLIYTSGTTGKPKGVMLTHRNLIENVQSCKQAIDVSGKDRFICILPMFHSFAWLVCVLLPLSIGGTIVIIESIQPFSNIMKAIFHYKVSLFIGIPQIFAALSRLPFFRPLHVFIPIRLCISGAAPLASSVLANFQKKFNIPLLEGYGLTETSPVVSLNPIKGPRKPGSIGIPVPGVSVKIIDDNGKELPPGKQVGELFVKGPNVMKGYYHLPEETKAVLSPDGWLRTGDMGYRDDDGYMFLVDRKKDMIISKGLNIYPKEVEDVLTDHPAVQEAAVIGILRKDEDEMVIAYITLKEGKSVNQKDLLSFCRTHIAAYKAPREIIISPELPKNTLGKVLKTKLREDAAKRYGTQE